MFSLPTEEWWSGRGVPGSALVLGVLALVGCAPSKEALSAGQIGCVPSDITISDEDSDSGFVQSTETWIAECRGRRFVCSKTMTQSSIAVASPSGSNSTSKQTNIDSDVACSEELSAAATAGPPRETAEAASPLAGSSPPAQPAPPPKRAVPSETPPPTGAGGFDFVLDPASAKSACEAASGVWEESSPTIATCTAVPRSIGFESNATLKFCAGSLCAVAFRLTTEERWLSTVVSLRTKLTEKYGEPRSLASIPTDCRSDPEFTACFKQRDLRLQYTWTWGSGERVKMVVGKPIHIPGPPAIRLQYERGEAAANVDSSAL